MVSRRVGLRQLTAVAASAAVGTLVGLALTPAASAAVGKPNLVVRSVSDAPARLVEGARFTVRDTVANTGRGWAGSSTVRYYLTTDVPRSLADRRRSRTDPRSAPLDILLVGARDVPRLEAGKPVARRAVSVQVPGGTPAGSYRLLACADDRGAIKERREHDNCTVAKRTSPSTVEVTVVPGALRSLSSLRRPLDLESAAMLPSIVKHEWCTPLRYRKLSAKAAVASATAHLKKTAGADALAAFRASPAHASAPAAGAAAAGAIVAGQPGAALAALLRAHALQPRKPTFLVSAATVATSIGLPSEALGLLDQAARLDAGPRGPMGLSHSALLQAGRAQALVRVGRYDEAVVAASAATTLAPELAEAHSTHAAAELCAGRDMIPRYAKSIKRETPEETPPHPLPPGEPWIDDSTGVPGTMRDLVLPATPMDAPYLHDVYKAKEAAEGSWVTARNDREHQLRVQLRDRPAQPATQERQSDLLVTISSVHLAPDLRAIESRFSQELDAARAEREAMFGSGDDPGRYGPIQDQARDACRTSDFWEQCVTGAIRAKCIGVAGGSHGVWRRHIDAAFATAREFQAEYGRRVSGIAGHLADPAAYELALLPITDREHGMRGLLVQEAGFWTGALHARRDTRDVHGCIATPNPETPSVADDEVPPAGPGPCRGAVKDMNLVVPLPFATIKGSCESLAVEFSTEGWIAAFAEVKYEFREGKVTIFGGAKADVGFGPVRGDFKSGIYVTAGSDGINDAGFRAGPSFTATGKFVEWNPSDMETFSLMGSTKAEG